MSASGSMSPNTARRLAALIVADAEQLQEKAEAHGVTAFLGKAMQRERPNERFLQNTLKNLASANKRADERVMWAAWEAQKEIQDRGSRQPGSSRSRKRSRSRSRSRDRGRKQPTHNEVRRSWGRDGVDRGGDRKYSRSRSRSRERRRHSRSKSPERQEVCDDEMEVRRGLGSRRGREQGNSHSRSSRRRCAYSNSPEWQQVHQDNGASGQGNGKAGSADGYRSRMSRNSRGGHRWLPGSCSRSASGSDYEDTQQPARRSRSHDAGSSRKQHHSSRDAAAAAAAGGEEVYGGSPTRSGISTSSGGSPTSSSDGSRRMNRTTPDKAAKGTSSDFDAADDEQLVQWLASSKTVRGRGSVGPRADLPGPYLEAPTDPQQLLLVQQGVKKGPDRPAWLLKDDGGSRLAPDAGFLRGVLRAQGIVGPVGAGVLQKSGDGQQENNDSRKRRKKRKRASGTSSSEGSDSSGISRKLSRRKSSSKHKQKRSKHKKHRKEKKGKG